MIPRLTCWAGAEPRDRNKEARPGEPGLALSWRPQSQALIQGAAGPELGTERARAEVGRGSMVAMCDQPPGGHLEWQGRAWRAETRALEG